MNERRTRQLIERELDGELSSLEREELARELVNEPGARRRRRLWSEVASAVGEPAPERPSLLLPRLEQAITAELRERRGAPRRSGLRLGRWALGGLATAAAAAALLLALKGAAPERTGVAPVPVRVAFEPPAPHHVRRRAPVSIDVRVTGDAVEGDAPPTTVTF